MSESDPVQKIRVRLTGARGVLGRSLQIHWPDIQWSIFPGNVENPVEVRQWLDMTEPSDPIIHLAAIVPTFRVENDPAKAIGSNVIGVCNLFEALQHFRDTERPWVFLASSSHVYASNTKPLAEDAPLAPATLYGLTKLQAEQWGLALARKYNVNFCIGRIFSYTSTLQASSYFVPAMIRRIAEAPVNAVMEIPGLHGTRDFSTTAQIAKAIRFLMERQSAGVFNIGSGVATRLLDVVTALRRRLGRDDVQIVALESNTAHLNADVGKLRSLGFELHWDLNSMLDEMIKAAPEGMDTPQNRNSTPM